MIVTRCTKNFGLTGINPSTWDWHEWLIVGVGGYYLLKKILIHERLIRKNSWL